MMLDKPIDDVQKIVLSSIRASLSTSITASLAKHNPSLVAEVISKDLIVKLNAYIVAMPTEKICVYHKYPKDWWQAVKERWFPKWAKNKWPIKYVVIDISENKFAVCPHLPCDGSIMHYEWLRDASIKNNA